MNSQRFVTSFALCVVALASCSADGLDVGSPSSVEVDMLETLAVEASAVDPLRASVSVVPVGYVGLAYAMPELGADEIIALRFEDEAWVASSLPAGEAFEIEAVGTLYDFVVAQTPLGPQLAQRRSFWRLPATVETGDIWIPARQSPLSASGLTYESIRNMATFDDPSTPEFDGIADNLQRFLRDEPAPQGWSLGYQKFAVGQVLVGVDRDQRAVLEKAEIAVSYGWSLRNADGEYELTSAGGVTALDLAGTHGSTQYLQATGRAVHAVASSRYAGQHRDWIAASIEEMETEAAYLIQPDVITHWVSRWANDSNGNPFAHKFFMMASALLYTAHLTDDETQAGVLAWFAYVLADMGISTQWDATVAGPANDGAYPERGGYDAGYHSWGLVMAEELLALIPEDRPLHGRLRASIDRAIDWLVRRIDPVTGALDIAGSTRSCGPENKGFTQEHLVREFIWWSEFADRPELVGLAEAVHEAALLRLHQCNP